MVITENVPIKHFEAFHLLIKSCNGQYTINPQLIFTSYSVGYTFSVVEDYIRFNREWDQYKNSMKPIKEKVSYRFKIISFFRKIFK